VDGVPFVAIPDSLREVARRLPDKPAVVCDERVLSWSQLDTMIDRVAHFLMTLGICRGDKVALLGANSIDYLVVFLGALRAGAVSVPLSTMAPADALARMIDDSDAKALFVSADYLPQIVPIGHALPKVAAAGRVAFDFDRPGWIRLDAALAGVPSSPVTTAIDAQDDFNIIYSSGTTGLPKGILHAHLMRSALTVRFAALGFSERTVSLVATPIYGNLTLAGMLPTLVHGGTVIMMRKFDAGRWLELAQQHRVTHAMLVPVMFQRMLARDDFDRFDLSAFVTKFIAGAPASPRLKQEILERWPGRLIELYGLTEGGPGTTLDATAHPDKLHTVGRPGLSVSLKIVGEDGRELSAGQVGEVVGRSDLMMMKSYYKQPGKTAELVWTDAGGTRYFRSGDQGKLDEDGFLVLLDRKKDMIISGGMNVYSSDIEEVVAQHENVAEAAVIGVPNEAWGETPLAIVVLKDPSRPDPGGIREWANARLGKAARLSDVRIVGELPRSMLGKVMKRELRSQFWPQETGAAGI